MSPFGDSEAQLEAAGAHWTVREILQQPQVWADIAAADDTATRRFLAPLLARADLRIVLTGAGTSAYVGECLAPALVRRLQRRVDAIATTDIVAGPQAWLQHSTPTLLVSFARSGNSPESLAALEIVQSQVRPCWHLIITCNREGDLYRRGRELPNAQVILLPEASHDRGFAMTSSFTGMVLAGALALGALTPAEAAPARLGVLASEVCERHLPRSHALGRFERAVFLGSNELKGLAREAALKMLELTDGGVVAVADSPLGFRHGPKTILNPATLVVVFLSADADTRRYEDDLVAELRRDAVAGRVLTLASGADGLHPDDLRLSAPRAAQCADLALLLPYAVFAQGLATLRSLSLGVRPDTPSASGTVSRVVKGVTIYPPRAAT